MSVVKGDYCVSYSQSYLLISLNQVFFSQTVLPEYQTRADPHVYSVLIPDLGLRTSQLARIYDTFFHIISAVFPANSNR
jgi:hypothetical protein